MRTLALNSTQVPKLGVGLLIGIAVLAILLVVFLSSLVIRVAIIVIAVALGAYVWQQRSTIENHISKDKCQLNTTFFGIHVKAPADVVQACQKQLSR